MKLLLSCFSVIIVITHVRSYPNGAPTGACEDMMPRHTGVQPQPYPIPYYILTNSWTFQPGQPITVTIGGPDYRGVLLEARTFVTTDAQGSWEQPPPDTKFLQCAGNLQGAVTHSNTNVKGNATVYTWMPPDTAGPVYFMATVAQQRTVYWTGVRSAVLTRGKPEDVSLATSGASAGVAEGKVLLVLVSCFLMFQMLA